MLLLIIFNQVRYGAIISASIFKAVNGVAKCYG